MKAERHAWHRAFNEYYLSIIRQHCRLFIRQHCSLYGLERSTAALCRLLCLQGAQLESEPLATVIQSPCPPPAASLQRSQKREFLAALVGKELVKLVPVETPQQLRKAQHGCDPMVPELSEGGAEA